MDLRDRGSFGRKGITELKIEVGSLALQNGIGHSLLQVGYKGNQRMVLISSIKERNFSSIVKGENCNKLYRVRHRNGRLLEPPRDGKYTLKVRGVFAQGWRSP